MTVRRGHRAGPSRRTPGLLALACAVVIAAVSSAGSAEADFPFPTGVNKAESPNYKVATGSTSLHNFSDSGDWELTGTPAPSTQYPGTPVVNMQQDQLCGVRGISVFDTQATQPSGSCATGAVNTAFQVTTGNPDVHIAVLDSGIKWNDSGVMSAVANKVWLNTGELPAPKHDLTTALAPGLTCSSFSNAKGGDYDTNGNYHPDGHGHVTGGDYDVRGTGAVNQLDWACDSRVAAALYPSSLNSGKTCPGSGCVVNPRYHGPVVNGVPVLTPEALILAFSDGTDHDHNGFANDIAGWNFVDDNNDPYDDVQYGHGSGEAQDSTAEANGGGTVGTCPNCMIMPLRVGESFVADANRFAQATLYATDMGADVVQEALGTYNDPYFTRQAIDYAYNHGVTVIASAADEAAEHHNQPGALPHTIVVNSVNQPESPETVQPPSYLQLNGCTNFGSRVDLSVEGSSCSSESTGKSSGVTGLIYSAAENALAAGKIQPSSDCTRVDGTPCTITPDEVRQLLASGNIGATTPADEGGSQADDVNFAQQPEPSCAQTPVATCTDPNSNAPFAADMQGGVLGPAPDTFQYPARKGWDEFYGYGRLNAYKAVNATANGTIPPEADITSPDWFQQIDPAQSSVALDGSVNARTGYTCQVQVAPGVDPNNSADFHTVPSSYCDGSTVHSSRFDGTLANVSVATIKSLFPAGNPTSFTGNENGGLAQTSNGRPNNEPYAFSVRVVVTTHSGSPQMTGEDRRQLYLHRDQDMLSGWPKELQADGDSSPILADIEGSNRNDLIVATSDGLIHAYRSDGSEAPGWPVHTESLPLHTGEHAYGSGGIGSGHYAAVIGGLAAGDLLHTGQMDVVADDMQGNVYAWNGSGQLLFHEHANAAFSGAPTDYPSNPSGAVDNVRKGVRDRTEGGFVTAPVLANLSGGPGQLDIVVAGEDRHVYAWKPDGSSVPGFPVLVEDPDKISAVDPTTNHLTFNSNAEANPGISEDQGKIIDTPAVASLNGPGKPPTIYLGTNEEYTTNQGDEGSINASGVTAASLGPLGQTGLLTFANGRVYSIKPTGGSFSCTGGKCSSSAFNSGWPVKIGIIDEGLLPDVGEGINGSPVVAPVTCRSNGTGSDAGFGIGTSPDAGPAYLLNPDGSSCYGSANGQYNTLEVDVGGGNGQKVDTPVFAAVGYPSFGTLDGTNISMFDQGAGAIRALDVALNGYQKGGQDFIQGWNTASGQFNPGYPAVDNDLGFLTGEVTGDITGQSPAQEVVAGTASLDVQAFNAAGQPASGTWPKLSGDWLVATPVLGSFGTLDTDSSAKKDVITVTRSGTLAAYSTPAAACSPSSWPNWHHDIANSGDYTRDAVPPGRPMNLSYSGGILTLTAPGNDLLCGTAHDYQVVSSAAPITVENFGSATPVAGAPAPTAAGTSEKFALPAGTKRYVAIRAEDAAGNIGLPASIDLGHPVTGVPSSLTSSFPGFPPGFFVTTAPRCIATSRHRFDLPRRDHIVAAKLYVDGRLKRGFSGKDLTAITGKDLPHGRFAVKIIATTKSGRKLVIKRRYLGCRRTQGKRHKRR